MLATNDIDGRGRHPLTDRRSSIESDNGDGRPAQFIARQTLPPERTEVTAAFAVLAIHVAGADGWCLGCATLWARLAPARCPEVSRAIVVVETGVAIDQYDEPLSGTCGIAVFR